MRPSKLDRAWAAGLYEGEGSISGRVFVRRGRATRTIAMSLLNQNFSVVRKFHRIVGVGKVLGPYGPYKSRRPYLLWAAQSQEDVTYAMNLLSPWLSRRRQGQRREALRKFNSWKSSTQAGEQK